MAREVMRPLQEMARGVAAGMHTLFSDIDDTLTTEGRLTVEAYAALEAVQRAGLRVVLVTGRPAGWCDHIARMWPVDAVIGENGAFWSWYDAPAKKLRTRHVADPANAARLREVQQRILRDVPGSAPASDQFCRLYDIAIDFCEDVPPLPQDQIQRIADIMQAEGMTAKISSIHVNGWFGAYDKLSTARLLSTELFGFDLDADRDHCVFVGDSPNDAPMFAYLPHAVGVANVRHFALPPEDAPAYVTQRAAGGGFAELSRFLIDARVR